MRQHIYLDREVYAWVDKIFPPWLAAWLNTTIIQNNYIYISYWSFIHFFSGILFYKFFSKKLKPWILIIVAFEIIEYSMGNHPLFLETTADVVWDLIFAIWGFMVARKYKFKHDKLIKR